MLMLTSERLQGFVITRSLTKSWSRLPWSLPLSHFPFGALSSVAFFLIKFPHISQDDLLRYKQLNNSLLKSTVGSLHLMVVTLGWHENLHALVPGHLSYLISFCVPTLSLWLLTWFALFENFCACSFLSLKCSSAASSYDWILLISR